MDPLPPEQLGLVQAVTAYEVLVGQAARTDDRAPAVGVLDALLGAHARYLPAVATPPGGDR